MAKSINFDTDIIKFNTGPADLEAEFTHDLGRVPKDGLIIQQRGGGDLYRSSTAWTSTSIFVQCSVAGSFFSLMLI